MLPAEQSAQALDWGDLAALGEQIVSATSLSAQRDQIHSMVSRLIKGEVSVWLQDNLFRLPNIENELDFKQQRPSAGMQRALEAGELRVKQNQGTKSNASPRTWAVIPLEEQGIKLGAIQITRPTGPAFKKSELNLLQGIAGIASVGLVASHRVAVERFRLNQLNLVREVSAQIVNAISVTELSNRVTKLIQKTFQYYSVAIFTLRSDSSALRFRASAMAPRTDQRKKKIVLDVEIGQGLVGQVAAQGERILVPDVQKDERYRYVDVLSETRSEVAIPLKFEGRVLGVLDVQSDRLNAFHPNDLLVLEALADTIARAVEGARLYGDLRRRANQLTLIAEVSKSVSASLNLNQLMEDVASLIHDQFRYPHVNLYTVHPNRRLIAYVAGSGARKIGLSGYTLSLDDAQGIIPWVARNGQTILAHDVQEDERYRPSPLPPENTRSELCVPLLYDGTVVGILDIQSDKANAFSKDDRIAFEAVADNIAIAIHNADLYRSEQWRRQVGESLREVAGLVSANVGVDDVLQGILDELDRNLPVDISAIWLFDEDELYLAACHNCDENQLEQTLYDSQETYDGLLAAVYSSEPIIRKPTDPLWVTGLTAGFENDYSALAAPLRIGEQPLGVITIAHRTPGRYGHEAQVMTTTFASYAAVAIENARLYDTAQEQAYASAALLQVAQAVVSLNDLDEILGTIIRIMPILVGIERAVLYQWNPENETFIPTQEYGLSEEDEKQFWTRTFSSGEFAFLDSCRNELGLRACQLDEKPDLQSWISLDPTQEINLGHPGAFLFAVPIAVKGTLYGVMLVEEAAGGLRFRSRRLEIITGVAQQAALAIQNDMLQREMVVRERLETEVQLARQIQQTFLPESLPEFENWQLSARWKTARQVGGDFYDVFDLPENRLGLFIADVSDKGVPAALFMALTRTLVHAAVIETDSPADALRRVNDLLIPDTKQGMFVTAVYAVLDMNNNELTYVNAGHNPPIWVKNDGSLEMLRRTGVALGAAENMKYEQRVISLEKDDCMLFYTDGLTESYNYDGEFYGEKRLEEALKANHCSSAHELIGVVEKSLLDFVQDMPPADDLTMLVLRRV
ncbi:MAG: GAF domain-containing protein [Anaerolineales bacterium]|nr:GAF domain-containing protein [Anaerolineales bacterium]